MINGQNFYTAVGLYGAFGVMLLGLFSTYPAVKAFEKGRNFLKWYVFGLLLFPFAFVLSLVIHDKRNAD
ncbi:hypothetical protein [Sporolactobacillus pectinivorans]|uniref:hypothetical protein n=1 Tax=Sporolactobacillus pectinivorans TaxID=1591408 RepID=UPI000C26B747|nr:hypothetical protein [Sporolactobacillus pectinivorans]